MTTKETDIVTWLKAALANWPELKAAYLFGSLADNTAQADSDLDLAVQMSGTLTAEKKMALIHHLAEHFGRPIDIIDLRQAGQPLLGEIAAKGVLVKGTASDRGDLFFRSIMMEEDFAPYQQRILAGRRRQWLNNE
ncbi:MAG: nucleotidyltransferase domain-containing protein [Natronospirillum sp.]|uniref:type VII toxin-antitoxin system MntA family adenylyltransferase antitoxin n=1 Tax=Natronospirillum sp. TaxID=2812955 RepID=UPI0025DEADC8|nr:nucleotidyltransferase domain-containing protein [Natronospirillum sp.]MCH8552268.1 nucleotidyltransferase domain-containing protein [Natronospirillum sp.]